MSCDWHIRCMDCGKTHRFDDANHEEELMAKLITMAPIFALLVHNPAGVEVHASWNRWRIAPEFFAEHLGHDLRPFSEYNDLSTLVIPPPVIPMTIAADFEISALRAQLISAHLRIQNLERELVEKRGS